MSRERSTWNREEIAKRAAMPKQADPYLMNQDHVKQQPAADAYTTGTPSTFGEDVHPSGGTWEAEYSGGQVKRNDIGMPEFRNDTFNHPEKTAKEKATKKAALCVAIARSMLSKKASDQDVMQQAVSFMHLPDQEVMATFQRMAGQEEEQEPEEEQGQKQAQDQEQQKAQEEPKEEKKEAGQVPPQFLEHQKGKKDDKEEKKDDKKDDEQTKQAALLRASQEQLAQMQQQMSQLQQQMAQMQGQPQQQVADQQQVQQQQAQQQMTAQQQQIAQMVEQQMASGKSAVEAAAYAAQQCMGQQQKQTDDALIDAMLADGGGIQAPTAEMDIQLEQPEMDMTEVGLGPEDEVLRGLFAQDQQGQGQQQEQQKQANVRTASSRTVGTRPTAGVTSIGGLPSAGNGAPRLDNLWGSAPCVKEAFGLPTDR